MPENQQGKKKIAILGGGLAALTAAFELTDYPNWEDHYEVTLYQIGWRLGGKTSCGRGPAKRVEEMGIHILQGWYNNTFRMIQTTYAYMQNHQLNPNSPFPSWQDGIIPDNATLFTQPPKEKGGEWTSWPMIFPSNKLVPGEGRPASIPIMLKEGIGIILEIILGSPYRPGTGCAKLIGKLMQKIFFNENAAKEAEDHPQWWPEAAKMAERAHRRSDEAAPLSHLRHAHELLGRMDQEKTIRISGTEIAIFEVAVHLIKSFLKVMRLIWRNRLDTDVRLHRLYVVLEFAYANMLGLLKDVYNPSTHTFDFHLINHLDYREWLQQNGAPEEVLQSALTRFIYGGAFHNQYQGQPGKLAADMGLRSLIVTVNYRGNLVWKMKGGTGATVTAPLYKVLKDRGVKFKFFHKVEEIQYSNDNDIETFTIGEQVPLAASQPEYNPLITINKDNWSLEDWPSEPLYEQIDPETVKKLKEREVNLESSWANWIPDQDYPVKTMKKGEDFDFIVLGIPVLALKHICKPITDNREDWKNMVDKVATTPTVQVQTWLKPKLAELGMIVQDWGMPPDDQPNSVIYADLLYSWTAMTLLIPFEDWPKDETPGQLSYWCGTWPAELAPFSDHGYPKREMQRLVDYTTGWLHENTGWFWPEATSPENPKGLNFDLLVDPTNPGAPTGEEKFLSQYFRVNVDPSYQYTLARPGTDQYRLRPDESGFFNLLLCGDWTNFGFNIGHIEGTVNSGLKAAQALRIKLGLLDNKEIFEALGE